MNESNTSASDVRGSYALSLEVDVDLLPGLPGTSGVWLRDGDKVCLYPDRHSFRRLSLAESEANEAVGQLDEIATGDIARGDPIYGAHIELQWEDELASH